MKSSFQLQSGGGPGRLLQEIGDLRALLAAQREEMEALLGQLDAKIMKPAIRGGFAVNDVRFFGTLEKAIRAIPSGQAQTLYITNQQTLSADLTIPSNISVVRLQGGGFTSSNGSRITFNGAFESPLTQAFFGSLVVRFGSGAVDVDFPQWWGGAPSVTDNTSAIQASVDAFTGVAGETYVTEGIWKCASGLTFPSTDYLLRGAGNDETRLKYTGPFGDFITIGNETDQTVNVRIRDIGLAGGDFLNGKARWVVYAHWFNSGCELTNVQIRDGVGLIRIRESFYGQIANLLCTSSTPTRALAGCTQAEWEEVHGDNRAPVMIMRANASDLRNIALYRVGSEPSGGVTPYAYVMVTGQATDVQLAQQACGTYTEDGTTYNLRARYGKVLGNVADGNGFIGKISHDYVEDCDWTLAGLYTEERSHVEVIPFWYQARCDGDYFYNAGAGDIDVRGGGIYGGYALALYHTLGTAGALSEGQDVNFHNTSVSSGFRVTDGGLAGGSDNVFDTAATGYLLGIADRGPTADRGTNLQRRVIPKVINGYAVTNSSDGTGDYVLLSGGVFMREDGEFVSNHHPTATNAPAWQKIRPTTASKFYRVFIGKAGQPFLVQYNAAQTDPTGNWIYEFATNASTQITGLTANARTATYKGLYLPNGAVMVYGSAVPVTGYWNQDDILWITSSTTATSAFYRCVTAGAPGTWVAVDDFTAKSLSMIGLTLSGSLTFTSAGIGANRIPFLNGSKVLSTSSSLAWDGTTATVGSFKSSSASSIAASGTGAVAGGSSNGLLFGSGPSLGIYFGSGAPTISAGKGSLYLRTNGSGTTDRAYINTDGSTTWTALTTVA